MVNLKNKTACVIDNGLFVAMADKLGESFGTTYYTVPWQRPFPKVNTRLVGDGYPHLTLCDSLDAVYEQIDILIVPDTYFPDMQIRAAKDGKRVWGSRHGEDLERDRVGTKKLMQAKGLPVGPYTIVKGMSALRKFNQYHTGKKYFVKWDTDRGHGETFPLQEKPALMKPVLDALEHSLGYRSEKIVFCVEEELPDCVEIGMDIYNVRGQFPKKTSYGIEEKGAAYGGVMAYWAQVPEPIRRWGNAFSGYLEEKEFANFISWENRITKGKTPYMIDPCMRAGAPPNHAYQVNWKNLAEIVWEGAGGVLVEPEARAQWCVEAWIYSQWAGEEWQPIEVEPAAVPYCKLRLAMMDAGLYWVAPQKEDKLTGIGAVVGLGDTLELAIAHCGRNAAKVHGYGLDIQLKALDAVKEKWATAKKWGLA